QLAEQEKSAMRRAAAFDASERARARSLLELIGIDAGQIVENLDSQLAARDHELRQRISLKADEQTRLSGNSATAERQARLDQELTLLLAEHDRFTAQIRQRHPRYFALADVQPLTLAEVRQQVLDDKTVLLEYALGAERSWLFAVTNTELRSFPLPPRRELEQAARRLHESLAAYGRARAFTSIQAKQAWQRQQDRIWQTAAINLSRMLLAQASPLLKGKRLLIVPDGALHYVPFAALPVIGGRWSVVGKKPGTSRATTDNRQLTTDHRPPVTGHRPPLIVHHDILTLPSASALAVLRRELGVRAPAEKTLAVFADPVYQRNDESGMVTEASARFLNDLARLPATRLEAEAISQLVSASARKVAYGLDANYAAATSAELSQYRYVHFATHGWLDSRRPALSGLVLSQVNAQGATQHATLRALDVVNLKLNAELVVLSGCQTGLGEEINGEGLVGLSRGFMYAGARRVAASLWQVNDAATAELMQRFYQGMLGKKKLSPAAALREAQLTIFHTPRWQSPYYWAAFTLQGDW
ncbi:MAG TPA: CHAT domain-containing protein, partial [Blastocatellia bacterium]|nr:CHAT domain-containing protein [Blastocatellia bacterium]